MESLFLCPVCREPLLREERRYVCPGGHSFDISAAGYTHLLPSNKMHSRQPGDDRGMASARNRFLSGGYYEPLLRELCRLMTELTPQDPVILDSGCGEGYYTSGIFRALTSAKRCPRMAGIDISKHSLRFASKRESGVEFAVASAFDLPFSDSCADGLLNCFSPLSLHEFYRVLKPGGVLVYVVPGARHLWELKKAVYDEPYENEEKETPYEGFSYVDILPVEGIALLETPETIHDLFEMTPYFWKTPPVGRERAQALQRLEVTISFRIHVFRKV